MMVRANNSVVMATTAVLILVAAGPWLLPLDRWLPERPLAARQQDIAIAGPLRRLNSPPPLQTFAAMTQRPLFNASRRAPSSTPASAGHERMLLGRYRLSGVVVTPERRLALLVDPKGRHIKVEEGGDLDGWRMLSISPRRLLLSKAGERLEHDLVPNTKRVGTGN